MEERSLEGIRGCASLQRGFFDYAQHDSKYEQNPARELQGDVSTTLNMTVNTSKTLPESYKGILRLR